MASSNSIHFGNALYRVPNLDEGKQFYSKIFGLKPYFDEPGWVVFDVFDYQFWLVPADSTEEHPQTWGRFSMHKEITSWRTKDIEATCRQFVDMGGAAANIQKDGPFSEAIITDPWGNTLGLVCGPFLDW